MELDNGDALVVAVEVGVGVILQPRVALAQVLGTSVEDTPVFSEDDQLDLVFLLPLL